MRTFSFLRRPVKPVLYAILLALILTAALLAIIPMIIIFLIGQKQIMNGMIEGAVKG